MRFRHAVTSKEQRGFGKYSSRCLPRPILAGRAGTQLYVALNMCTHIPRVALGGVTGSDVFCLLSSFAWYVFSALACPTLVTKFENANARQGSRMWFGVERLRLSPSFGPEVEVA